MKGLVCLLCLVCWADSRELLFVQTVSRHGARTPTFSNPFDLSDIALANAKPGELTSPGKYMHYLLGRTLYNKYWQLLFSDPASAAASPQELYYAKATNTDRTIESMEYQLMGLLEALGSVEQTPNHTLMIPPYAGVGLVSVPELWRVGPVHVEKGAEGQAKVANPYNEGDFLIKEEHNLCPRQLEWQNRNFESDLAQRIMSDSRVKSALSQLQQAIPGAQVTFRNAFKFYDNYICLKAMGHSYLSVFDKSNVKQILQFIYVARLYLTSAFTETQTKALATRFMTVTEANMKKAESGGPKLVLYVAHDSTIALLLAAMKFASLQCIYEKYLAGGNGDHCYWRYPSFASSLTFQVWQDDNGSRFLKVLMNGQVLPNPLCNHAEQCSLELFQQWIADFIVPDPNAACGIPNEADLQEGIPIHWIYLVVPFLLGALCLHLSGLGKAEYGQEAEESEFVSITDVIE